MRVVVIGAGPAGLMASWAAARAGARVTLVEAQSTLGLRLAKAGGGRGNVTNTFSPDEFCARLQAGGRFARPALHAFGPAQLCHLLDELGIGWHSPDGLRVYPRHDDASLLARTLVDQCVRAGVRLLRAVRATGLSPCEEGFTVTTTSGPLGAHRVIIATGGLARPSWGTRGDGLRWAQALGHTVVEPVPALTPLVTRDSWPRSCAGVALPEVSIQVGGGSRATSRGPLLFTHQGISGPAALDISGFVARMLLTRSSVSIHVNLTPPHPPADWTSLMDRWHHRQGAKPLASVLASRMPRRVARVVCALAEVPADEPVARLSSARRAHLAQLICRLPLTVSGTGGFEQAMVTSGGVSTKELDPSTMESRLVKGAFFAGEVVDVHGPTGGFNLQWAFSSGWVAGNAAATSTSSPTPE